MSLELLNKTSPMMQQWHDCKKKSPGSLLLFRLGDFYEAFYEDASLLASELDLTLTQRGGIPMSGIPVQSLDTYVEKLIQKGFLVAIADQLEAPDPSKKLVERGIVKIVSPATFIPDELISLKTNQFISALCQINHSIGIVFIDISTSECLVLEVEKVEEAINVLFQKAPKELILSKKLYETHILLWEKLKLSLSLRWIIKEDWLFNPNTAHNFLKEHFEVHSLDGFGLKGHLSIISALGTLLSYLEHDLCQNISLLKTLSWESSSSAVNIDLISFYHLNIFPAESSPHKDSLLSLLDQTKTPMGGRLMKKWLASPLLDISIIQKRQDAIEELLIPAKSLRESLSSIRDLERLAMRISSLSANPRDLYNLAHSLSFVTDIKNSLSSFKSSLLCEIQCNIDDFSQLSSRLQKALVESPPLKIQEGGIFRPDYHKELKELQSIKENHTGILLEYQNTLRETLGIKTLKVSYNKAFGYFIEVSRGQKDKMPPHFQRKQTLISSERFVTPELQEIEKKILFAEEKCLQWEQELFFQLRDEMQIHAESIKRASHYLAMLDSLISLAYVASLNQYKRPLVDNSTRISIHNGRHPLIERTQGGDKFIANDTYLDNHDTLLNLITGPNMAGKSTYIRQTALIVIMAQIGSFVPAESARIGVVDKVFTRIGASDDLSRGQSTFMVEMSETANILHNATSRSLIILDEIGRGTSTYDGIAIAWATLEYIITEIKAKTLFATHFWELTKLESEFKEVKNMKVHVLENEDGITFLHKIIPGGADKSYGIFVAKLAGMPKFVLDRARILLKELEEGHPKKKVLPSSKNQQLSLFEESEKELSFINQEIKELDLNTLTPLKAFELIQRWKNGL